MEHQLYIRMVSFILQRVTWEEVRRPVQISPRIIKDSLPVILGPLTEIIVPSAPFHSAWKKAEVIPIYKEGDHDKLTSNNRPVSFKKSVKK